MDSILVQLHSTELRNYFLDDQLQCSPCIHTYIFKLMYGMRILYPSLCNSPNNTTQG
jgi:hypothetical protein